MTATTQRALLGCIADDFTGATDLANMLVRGGMRTRADHRHSSGRRNDRGGRTRRRAEVAHHSLPQMRSRNRSPRSTGCARKSAASSFFKYCSTFDSTDAGNIGPVTDALLDVLCAVTRKRFHDRMPGVSRERPHDFSRASVRRRRVAQRVAAWRIIRSRRCATRTSCACCNVRRESQGRAVRCDAVAKGAAAVRESFDALREQGARVAIADAVSDADLYVLGEARAPISG